MALPTLDKNLRYITRGTSLVNEAPPMPLRASSHPGSPNSPSCSALAWYSCWLGLSPWGESGDRTPAARTAVLTRYRYATQQLYNGSSYTVKMFCNIETARALACSHITPIYFCKIFKCTDLMISRDMICHSNQAKTTHQSIHPSFIHSSSAQWPRAKKPVSLTSRCWKDFF